MSGCQTVYVVFYDTSVAGVSVDVYADRQAAIEAAEKFMNEVAAHWKSTQQLGERRDCVWSSSVGEDCAWVEDHDIR
ncbi:MAG: hypothetical protein KDD44_03930 [Bdellovibrionales bacterium]|nr:hypothetical protein [Bdellovibrionales bacterium]